jgi:hypothetical protein
MVNGFGTRVEPCQITAHDNDIGCDSIGAADAYPRMRDELAVGPARSGIDFEPVKIALH